MIRFSAVDFRCQGEVQMPSVESAQAWRVFGKMDDTDSRDFAPRDWILQPGQTISFQRLPSFGDAPGDWSAQAISSAFVDRSDEVRTKSRFYVFGGCRTGGTPTAKKVPSRKQIVLGRDCPVKPGLRVQLIPKIVEQTRFGRVVGTTQVLKKPSAFDLSVVHNRPQLDKR